MKNNKLKQFMEALHHRFAPFLFFICIGSFIAWCIGYFLIKKFYPDIISENGNIVLFLWKVFEMILISGVVQATIKYFDASKKIEAYISQMLDSKEFTQKISTIFTTSLYSHKYLEEMDIEKLNDIWKEATTVLIKKDFPDIHTKVAKKVSNIYFNDKNLSYYYKDYTIFYDLDIDKDNFITITQKSDFKLKRNSLDPLIYSFKYDVEKVDQTDVKTAIVIKNFNIDGMPVENIAKHTAKSVNKDGGEKIVLDFEIELSGKSEYTISHEIVFVYSIDHDNEWYFSMRKITDGLFLEIQYSDNLEYKFSEIGHEKFIQTGPHKKRNSTICTTKYDCEDVFLPMNGFRLLF